MFQQPHRISMRFYNLDYQSIEIWYCLGQIKRTMVIWVEFLSDSVEASRWRAFNFVLLAERNMRLV